MTTHRAFWLPRRGYRPEEYEDAFAADPVAGRFALADGATESAFADSWARLLVDDFVQQRSADLEHWTNRLPHLLEQWQTAVGGQPLPYYVKDKFRRGAFATFLGLILGAVGGDSVGDEPRFPEQSATESPPTVNGTAPVFPGTDYCWRAVAVGDTCLFHTRAAELLAAFPLGESQQFNNYPDLVGSRAAPEQVRDELSVHARGIARPGDRLWLMTDALAQWCLARHEAGQGPWAEMNSLSASPERDARFAAWIEGLRDDAGLHDDDVTLVVVSF